MFDFCLDESFDVRIISCLLRDKVNWRSRGRVARQGQRTYGLCLASSAHFSYCTTGVQGVDIDWWGVATRD